MGLPAAEVSGVAREINITAIRATYSRHTGRKALLAAVLLGLTGATALVATAVGAAGISVADVWRVVLAHLGIKTAPASDLARTVVWEIRLPRIVLATITGVSLAGAGAVMQGVLRNPLVSPYTMGLSSGAAFGAALAIVLGTGLVGGNYLEVSRWLIVTNAFIFGGVDHTPGFLPGAV